MYTYVYVYVYSIKAFQSTKSLPKELMWDIGTTQLILQTAVFLHCCTCTYVSYMMYSIVVSYYILCP